MKRYPLAAFFVLAFAISWAAVGLLHVVARNAGVEDFGVLMEAVETTFSAADLGVGTPVWALFLLSRIVDFGPSLAGLIVAGVVGGAAAVRAILRRLFDVRVGGAGYAWSLLLPAALVGGALLVHRAFGDGALTAPGADAARLVLELFFWVILMRTLLGGGMGEELGWRGFALPRLLEGRSAVKASWVIGVVWVFWHLPAHLVASTPLVSFGAQFLFTVPLAFVFTWLYLKFDGRLLPVVLFHGALNGYNVFVERSLFPQLVDEDGFVIGFILMTLIAGVLAWRALRRMDKVSGVAAI